MSDNFTENALSWGEEGRIWLNSIPSLIAKYEKQWSLTFSSPFHLSYNYVAPALRADGTQTVLKIGFPKDTEFRSEIKALTIFNGEAAVQLLEADSLNAVILIEHVKPGRPLSGLTNDDEATIILARLMQKLHKPLPKNHSFTSIKELSVDITNYIKVYRDTGPLSLALVEKAQSLFIELIDTSKTQVLVHGDLHQDNIISSEKDGWVAIDPKGIAAEPLYEVAAMIRNPYEKLKDVTNLEPLLRKRILLLAHELKADPTRILKWCIAHTVLSAVWNVGTPNGPEHCRRVAEVLVKMKL